MYLSQYGHLPAGYKKILRAILRCTEDLVARDNLISLPESLRAREPEWVLLELELVSASMSESESASVPASVSVSVSAPLSA